jgi:hypothetical protein
MASPNALIFPTEWHRGPDAQALFEQGTRLEAQASQVLAQAQEAAGQLTAEARRLFDTSARGGSLDGMLALARLAVADGASFGWAQNLLAEVARRLAHLPGRAAVIVAPDVLGPNLRLDDSDSEDERDPVFTVVSPDPERAAETLDRVSGELMCVDEHGRAGVDRSDGESYTPNYAAPVMIGAFGAQLRLDTKGWMSSKMGRTMTELVANALVTDGVPAVLAGDVENLENYFAPWEHPGTEAT